MKKLNVIIGIYLFLLILSCSQKKQTQLFDGKTLTGWEGSTNAFRVENGAIIGGSLDKGLEESFYLCTNEQYTNFELTLSVKLIHSDLKGNAGISFRAQRVEGSNRVASYQADIGYIHPYVVERCSNFTPADMNNPFSLWGALIDECRGDISRYPDPEFYPAVVLKMPERELIQEIAKPDDWNEVQVFAMEGKLKSGSMVLPL